MWGKGLSSTAATTSAWAASSIKKDGTIRPPFGSGRTSPVAACWPDMHDRQPGPIENLLGQLRCSHRSGARALDAAATAAELAISRDVPRGIYNIAEEDDTISGVKAKRLLGWDADWR